MQITDQYVDNKGVKIHYLESNPTSRERTPLVYIPGILGPAEDFKDEMETFQSRKCIAMSLRGCGKSEAPSTGYSFENHYSDVEAIIDNSDFNKFYLMAYSMGVPYAINATSKYSDKVKGLIICDYPARMPELSEEWAQRVLSRSSIDKSKEHFVISLQKQMKETTLFDRLNNIKCPVLIIRGLKEDAMLKANLLEEYKNRLQEYEIVEFENSGHALWMPDPQRFLDTIEDFMNRMDK